MSPRNRVRAVVAVLGLALIVHGLVQIFQARDADAASCTVGAVCTEVGQGEAAETQPRWGDDGDTVGVTVHGSGT